MKIIVVLLQPKSEKVFIRKRAMQHMFSTSQMVVARQKCRANALGGGGKL